MVGNSVALMNKLNPTRQVVDAELDILIIGAGLSGLCLAYCLKKLQPTLKVLTIEAEHSLNHEATWSFHNGDILNFSFWSNFIDNSWDNYDVRFSREQVIEQSYSTIQSQSFFQKMRSELGENLILGTSINQLRAHSVQTDGGQTITAKIVIDARSQFPYSRRQMLQRGWGFQKFYGIEIRTEQPHGLVRPVLMDASVPQKDGYRFVYVLPLSSSVLLVEDTYYSNTADLAIESLHSELLKFAASKGWHPSEILRTEKGILPVPTSIHPIEDLDAPDSPLKIGAGAGFYHPITGYSLLWSSRVAQELASIDNPTAINYRQVLARLHRERQKQERFYLFLNRLMFFGSETRNRRNIFERFYQLPSSTIARFYAGRTNWFDRCRLLVGKPPIPVLAAVKALLRRPSLSTPIALEGKSL